MSGESPDVILYDSNSNALAVQNGVAIPASTPALMIAGSDGTNSRYITIDTSGRFVAVGAGVAGTPAGGVITIQGVSGGTVIPVSGTITANQGAPNTLANAWPHEITDGTNGPAAVKAASTAAVTTDPALVVALSPNSLSPVVADAIGTGTISALNGFVTVPTQGYSSANIGITGSWVGTLTFQFTIDGTNWVADSGTSALTAQISSSTTVNGTWSFAVGGYKQYRVIATAWTSGSATIAYDVGVGFNAPIITTTITDVNGNIATVKPASTSALATDTSIVVSISPNNVASVQGTSADNQVFTGNPLVAGGVDFNGYVQQVSSTMLNGLTHINVVDLQTQNKLDNIILLLSDIRDILFSMDGRSGKLSSI